jgi:hypothetical protein
MLMLHAIIAALTRPEKMIQSCKLFSPLKLSEAGIWHAWELVPDGLACLISAREMPNVSPLKEHRFLHRLLIYLEAQCNKL